MLAEMMGTDLEQAVGRLQELGIRHLDLKNHVFGRSIEDLDPDADGRLADLVDRTGVEVYCFSSVLGHQNVSRVEEPEFRRAMAAGLDNMLRTARRVRPRLIRLLACGFDGRDDWPDSNAYLERQAPWVYAAYADAIERIHDAGITATLENEPRTIFSNPAEAVAFIARLNLGAKVGFTWDVQNMWQSGVFPTLDVYGVLAPITNYVHLKGGRGSAEDPRVLTYRSPLEDAGWPVPEIVGAVLADGISPVICLNPSHGAVPPDDAVASPSATAMLVADVARRDVAFLRRTFREVS